MTVKDVVEEVEYIRSIAGDDEAAHGAEDDLWEKVLKAIATGQYNFTAHSLAGVALKTKEIRFARWCA